MIPRRSLRSKRSALPAWFEVIPVPPGAAADQAQGAELCTGIRARRVRRRSSMPRMRPPPTSRAPRWRLSQGPANLAVVQAPLQIHNGGDSWIARQFALEYAIHFRVWLPLLAQLKLPIPLGGTSNYFRRNMLAAGWRMGRLERHRRRRHRNAPRPVWLYVAGMISPATLEEAPTRWRQWRTSARAG